MKLFKRLLVIIFILFGYTQAWAGKTEDEEMAQMQRKLNHEVMDKPFFAEEPEKVDAYIKEATKNKLTPPEYTGQNWHHGYTCHDMLRYSWIDYRNCSYYYHYYGHYYPSQEPAQNPGQEPARQPAQNPGQEPARQPAQNPGQEPARQPAQNPGQEPARQPVQKPGQEPARQPAQKPGQESARQPNSKGIKVKSDY